MDHPRHVVFCNQCKYKGIFAYEDCSCGKEFSFEVDCNERLCDRCQTIFRFNPKSEPDLRMIEIIYGNGEDYEEDYGIALCSDMDTNFCYSCWDVGVRSMVRYMRAGGSFSSDIGQNAESRSKMDNLRKTFHEEYKSERLEYLRKRIAARKILRFCTYRFKTAKELHDHLWRPGGVMMEYGWSKFHP